MVVSRDPTTACVQQRGNARGHGVRHGTVSTRTNIRRPMWRVYRSGDDCDFRDRNSQNRRWSSIGWHRTTAKRYAKTRNSASDKKGDVNSDECDTFKGENTRQGRKHSRRGDCFDIGCPKALTPMEDGVDDNTQPSPSDTGRQDTTLVRVFLAAFLSTDK